MSLHNCTAWISTAYRVQPNHTGIRSASRICVKRTLKRAMAVPRRRISCSTDSPEQSSSTSQRESRGINGTAPLYAVLALAQTIPFVFPQHGGVLGDIAYFTTTAAAVMTLGCLRGPLEPPALSAPISGRQAFLAPFAASLFLFGSYLLLKYTQLDIGLLFNAMTTFLGALCSKEALDPVLYSLLALVGLEETKVWERKEEGDDETQSESISLASTLSTIAALALTAAYIAHVEPTFVFSNMIALAICSRVLSLVKADSFLVAAGLLCGLFCYDIFWVFGSEVMVSVATQIDSPGKLLFPREVAAGAAIQYPYAILGLGDVCVPGIFASVALAMDGKIVQKLRGERAREVKVGPYFGSAIGAYIVGLLACFGVNLSTGAAQPALLYLVPACIGSSVVMAGVRGEVSQVFSFRTKGE